MRPTIAKKVLKQIGKANTSSHHLLHYAEKQLTLRKVLTMILSPTKFKSRSRGIPATGYYKFFVIDWDDKRKGFKETLRTLEMGNISYIAFPSPSHWVKRGYRMRILIPLSGVIATTKEGYEAQYLAFLSELGLPIPDKTASDTKRFFYPPVMRRITQPNHAGQKPTNQSLLESKKKVQAYLGIRFPLRSVQESMKLSSEQFPKLYKQKKSSGKFERSKRGEIYLPKTMVLNHKGKKLGTFEEAVTDGGHYRIDCPFDDAHNHADGEGRDYAFVQGNKIICDSNTHGHVIGRMDIFSC